MRAQRLVILLILVACSSTQHATPDPAATPANVSIAGSGTSGVNTGSLRVNPSYDVAFDTIHTSLDRVWAALPAIYTALSIPITTADTKKYLFGNEGMKVYRRLGETPLTRLLDCGRTQIGPNADSYEIVMSVTTLLRPHEPQVTIVTTSVDASGRPMQYGGGDTRCRTKGELERQIALALRARFER